MSDAEAILRHYKDFTVLSEQVPPRVPCGSFTPKHP